jgi:hypothetical protein
MISGGNPVDRYMDFLNRFRGFVDPRQEWLPEMRQVDKCVCPAWCDNKLWDKM